MNHPKHRTFLDKLLLDKTWRDSRPFITIDDMVFLVDAEAQFTYKVMMHEIAMKNRVEQFKTAQDFVHFQRVFFNRPNRPDNARIERIINHKTQMYAMAARQIQEELENIKWPDMNRLKQIVSSTFKVW